MNDKVTVTLIGPAKVGGKRHPVGKVLEVDTDIAGQLTAAGAIGPVSGSEFARTVAGVAVGLADALGILGARAEKTGIAAPTPENTQGAEDRLKTEPVNQDKAQDEALNTKSGSKKKG